MVCLTLIKFIGVFLIFYVKTSSCVVVNTTQYDNFTIEWEDFNLLTCSTPTTINISIFTCSSTIGYTQIDDMYCLQETVMDFDQNTCQAVSTTSLYTTNMPTSTQQITTVSTVTTAASTGGTTVQTVTSATAVTTQSSTIISSNSSGNPSTQGPATSIPVSSTPVTTYTSQVSSVINSTSTTRTTTTSHSSITSTTSSSVSSTIASTTSTTTIVTDIYNCPTPGYIGTYCNISSDACAMSQPCLNAATCFPNHTLPNGYRCQCQSGYTGYNCEYDERACMENTCWHNGTCIPVNSTVIGNNGSDFRCECVQGYNGVYCELKVDLCVNITCENHGRCLTSDYMWQCLCLDSTLYYGTYCQYKTNKLKLREILSKSFASIAIGAIVTTCSFVIIMDILKYAFHIDPVECERESYRQRREAQRVARRPPKPNREPKLALRFQYIS